MTMIYLGGLASQYRWPWWAYLAPASGSYNPELWRSFVRAREAAKRSLSAVSRRYPLLSRWRKPASNQLCIGNNERKQNEKMYKKYQLRQSQSNQLIVPTVKLSTYHLYGPRSFAVAGPTIWWNNLSEYMRDPELSIDNFRRQLKTFLFAQYWRWHLSALDVPVRSINLLFRPTFTLH